MAFNLDSRDLEKATRVLPYLALGFLTFALTIGIAITVFARVFPHLLDGATTFAGDASGAPPNMARNFFELMSFTFSSISGLALPFISLFALWFTWRQISEMKAQSLTADKARAFDAYNKMLTKWDHANTIEARKFYYALSADWQAAPVPGREFHDHIHDKLVVLRQAPNNDYRNVFLELAGLLEEFGFLFQKDENLREYMFEIIGSDLRFITSALIEHVKWRRGQVERSQTTYFYLIYLYEETLNLEIKSIDGYVR